jgi:hypothetical protein
MLRRYLVAVVGAVVGWGLAAGVLYAFDVWSPSVPGACALALAGFLMAKGEDLGLVPPSEEVNRPTSILGGDADERGR